MNEEKQEQPQDQDQHSFEPAPEATESVPIASTESGAEEQVAVQPDTATAVVDIPSSEQDIPPPQQDAANNEKAPDVSGEVVVAAGPEGETAAAESTATVEGTEESPAVTTAESPQGKAPKYDKSSIKFGTT